MHLEAELVVLLATLLLCADVRQGIARHWDPGSHDQSPNDTHQVSPSTAPPSRVSGSACWDLTMVLAFRANKSPSTVLQLNESHMGWGGSIPSSIHDFTSLEVLNLDVNSLTGPVPVELFNMPSLQVLNASHNSLTLQGLPLESLGPACNLKSLDLSSNLLNGTIPPRLSACKNLTYLSLANNSFVGGIPEELGQLLQLEILDLSNNNLTGNVTTALLELPAIRRINLNSNSLSGTLPASNYSHSFCLSLNENNLSREIPSSLWTTLGSNLSVGSSPASCGTSRNSKLLLGDQYYTASIPAPSAVKDRDRDTSPHSHPKLEILGVVFASLLALVALLLLLLSWCKHHNDCRTLNRDNSRPKYKRCTSRFMKSLLQNPLYWRGSGYLESSLSLRNISGKENLRILRIKEIKKATGNFRKQIGTGGCGFVYKGVLPGGEAIAVKRSSEETEEGNEQMLQEIDIMSGLSHKHLVPLLGYCVDRGHLMLVYEYMPRGTVEDHLFGKFSQRRVLGWRTRVRIACECASAIAYLHTEATRSIIHRDIKTSNILLDRQFHARLGDFGLCEVIQSDEDPSLSHVDCTSVKGTTGYVDPFYKMSQKLTHKSDVYSFGVVLLELITGKQAFDESRPELEWHLPSWVEATHPLCGSEGIIDARIPRGTYIQDVLDTMIDCGRACCNLHTLDERPAMSEVLEIIQQCLATEYRPRSPIDIMARLGPSAPVSPKPDQVEQ